VTTTGGGRVLRPPGPVTSPLGGGTGGGVVPSWQSPCWPGTDGEGSGTCSYLSPPRMCSWCNILMPIFIHPSWDKQVPSMKLPRRLTVSLPLAIGEAPTVLSLEEDGKPIKDRSTIPKDWIKSYIFNFIDYEMP
jgi:hypothetical protein